MERSGIAVRFRVETVVTQPYPLRVELRRATTLGFGGLSTKFPSRPQSDSHNPRFRKAPIPSRTIGFPESGCRS